MARLGYITDPMWFSYMEIRKWTIRWTQIDSERHPYIVYSKDWPSAGIIYYLNAFQTERQAQSYIDTFTMSRLSPPAFSKIFSKDEYECLKKDLIQGVINKTTTIIHKSCTKCGFEYPYGGPAICSGCNLWLGQYV